MKYYMMRSDRAEGGYYSLWDHLPDPDSLGYHARSLVSEIREIDDDGGLFESLELGEVSPGPDGSLDNHFVPLWIGGKTVWTRET